MGVSESSCLEWAEALARRGLGCLGIDAADHGSRGTFTSFFSVDDLPVLRDRFREMTFDLLQVERAAITFDLDGDAVPDVAPRLRYFGNSMGASAGSSRSLTDGTSTRPRRESPSPSPPSSSSAVSCLWCLRPRLTSPASTASTHLTPR